MLLIILAMPAEQKILKVDDLVQRIVLQKRAQQVEFLPCAPLVDPFLHIFEGIKHIMKMDIDAGFETREEFKKDAINIRIHL